MLQTQIAGETFMQKIGMETNVKTGDPQFDSRFDVDFDDSAFATAYFASSKKREAVYALFAKGCSAIEMDNSELRADWFPFRINENSTADFVNDALPHLTALSEELPASISVQPMRWIGHKNYRSITQGLILVLLLILVASLFFYELAPLDSQKFFLRSLRYSVPVYLAFLVITAMLLKGKSWFFSGLMRAVVAGLLLFPLLLGYCGGVWLNATRDNSQPTVYRQEVQSKSIHESSKNTAYFVRVLSWREAGGIESFSVSGHVYYQVQPGLTVAVVETKPGYFGYEFVKKIDFIYSPPPSDSPATPQYGWPPKVSGRTSEGVGLPYPY